MGVDNGYTETDVQELARVFTGWNVCNKNVNDVFVTRVGEGSNFALKDLIVRPLRAT